ncbi:hypothetical protein BDV27DRAFT_153305 [Aspergillus caelatus]|uniref:Uncharacterized protein n=1 Tax=Aspergillus caelatus TaxID=61420 RepID=A0A5N7AH82_9EURO|nr:uncharacterized protein BDV27DRAFT_153305 [Aspergillus caelatus]KAE8369231.1 hypothetical protein BDV27DRAFT_153305 [Aspergillus caelatus]
MTIQSCPSGGNLWQKAPGDIITEILEETEKKKKLCLKKRWKVEFRGKTIILRDLLDKIIEWARQFTAIVDVAVQYDPTSASLLWAGIRFLLHVAVSDRECFESTVYGLESVSLLIARYVVFEVLYLQKGSIVEAELERGLINLYNRILTFLANGIRYPSQSIPVCMVKSIFQSSQNEEVDQITKSDEEALKLARMVDSQAQQQVLLQVREIRSIVKTLQSPVHRLVDESMIYVKTIEEGKSVKILQWLSSVPYTQHQKRYSDGRLPNSSEWIFRHPEYITWKGSSSLSILLLHGISGSGKTHLVTAVIDVFLTEHLLNSLSVPIAYV